MLLVTWKKMMKGGTSFVFVANDLSRIACWILHYFSCRENEFACSTTNTHFYDCCHLIGPIFLVGSCFPHTTLIMTNLCLQTHFSATNFTLSTLIPTRYLPLLVIGLYIGSFITYFRPSRLLNPSAWDITRSISWSISYLFLKWVITQYYYY